jgi:transcriptional regulator with PAS, ATPase and Fis domain
LSDTSLLVGDLQSARHYIDNSINILREIDARHELAISLMKSADLTLQELENGRSGLPRLTQLNEAWNQATGALDLFIRVDVSWWTEKSRAQVARIANMRAAQERADKKAAGKEGKAGAYNPGDVIIHTSGVMRDLLHLADMFAGSEEPVLITGETGTGKELIARRIHQHSSRRDAELVTINVAAIPHTMFEREFFGHVRGAFSGADRDGEGYAARANGGTLFLDEIGDLPLEAQPKLLRLLQEGTYQAIGDPHERHSDIRLVAATNSNLHQRVAQGKFRSDLFYRLKILDLELPPVRDREEDVLPLLRHFLCLAANRYVDLAEYFNGPSLAAIEKYAWPGNVREIAMVARRAHVALTSLGKVEIKIPQDHGEPLILSGPGFAALKEAAGGDKPILTSSEAADRSRILMALDEAGGNRNAAAKALGVGRSTLYRRMIKLGIPTRRN